MADEPSNAAPQASRRRWDTLRDAEPDMKEAAN